MPLVSCWPRPTLFVRRLISAFVILVAESRVCLERTVCCSRMATSSLFVSCAFCRARTLVALTLFRTETSVLRFGLPDRESVWMLLMVLVAELGIGGPQLIELSNELGIAEQGIGIVCGIVDNAESELGVCRSGRGDY